MTTLLVSWAPLTLRTAAVGAAWPLLGSPRNGQAVLCLFQKHWLCLEYINSFTHCGCFLNGQKILGGACAVLLLLAACLLNAAPTSSKQYGHNCTLQNVHKVTVVVMLLSFGIKAYKINTLLNIQAFWTAVEPCRLVNNYRCLEGSCVCVCVCLYTGCFTTLGHNCRRWFPRSLWWKKFI